MQTDHDNSDQSERSAETPTAPRIPIYGDGHRFGDGGRVGTPRNVQQPTPTETE